MDNTINVEFLGKDRIPHLVKRDKHGIPMSVVNISQAWVGLGARLMGPDAEDRAVALRDAEATEPHISDDFRISYIGGSGVSIAGIDEWQGLNVRIPYSQLDGNGGWASHNVCNPTDPGDVTCLTVVYDEPDLIVRADGLSGHLAILGVDR